MSDKPIQGPTMLAATEAIKAPPIKIGKISDDLVLPRAIPLVTLAVVVAFALVGAIVGLIVGGLQGFIMGGAISGFAGYIIANYSPLRGESFLKWITLTTGAKRNKLEVDGEPVTLYVGIAQVRTPAAGRTRMRPGAVDVNPVHYDERGVLRRESLRDAPTFTRPERAEQPVKPKGEAAAPKPVKVKTRRGKKRMPD